MFLQSTLALTLLECQQDSAMASRNLHDVDLDPRAREVLREVVMQYIDSGEPIGSRTLSKCGRFQLSPASIRNVMADLEDLGFLQQPHTSSTT